MHYVTSPYCEVDEDKGESRPQIVIPHGKDEREKTYVAILGKGDSHSCASSSKRQLHGPGVVITDMRLDGTHQAEYDIDDDHPWDYINRVISNLKGKIHDDQS